MKKFLLLFLAVILVFAMAACSSEEENKDDAPQTQTTENTGKDTTSDDKKTDTKAPSTESVPSAEDFQALFTEAVNNYYKDKDFTVTDDRNEKGTEDKPAAYLPQYAISTPAADEGLNYESLIVCTYGPSDAYTATARVIDGEVKVIEVSTTPEVGESESIVVDPALLIPVSLYDSNYKNPSSYSTFEASILATDKKEETAEETGEEAVDEPALKMLVLSTPKFNYTLTVTNNYSSAFSVDSRKILGEGAVSETVFWEVGADKKLVVFGRGEIPDYSAENPAPWTGVGYTEAEISSSITSLGAYAFANSSKLTAVTIPETITEIKAYTFTNCSSLQSIELGENVTSIGDYAFKFCTQLTDVTFSENLESIGEGAFFNCTLLSGLDMNDNIVEIKPFTFRGCASLGYVTFGNATSTIGDYAFAYSGIPSIVIPETVTSFGTDVFSGCEKLENVVIKAELDSIPEYTFLNCKSLVHVLPASLKAEIGEDDLGYCIIPDTVKAVETDAFAYCSALETLALPEGVLSIGDHAFYNCTYLMSASLPDTITEITDGAFKSCSQLKISAPAGGYLESFAAANNIDFINTAE